jgi:hypothetical protein
MIDPRVKDLILNTLPCSVLNVILPQMAPARSPWKPEILAKKAIFIHMPKTAGSSLKEQLYGTEMGGHRSLAEYRAYDRHSTQAFFKFCFVRNPWDRFLSAYTYLKQGHNSTYRDKEFAKTYLSQTRDVNDFADRLAENRAYRAQVMLYDHFRPQSHWICLPGAKDHGMDFIGQFESLDASMADLRTRLKLPDTPLPQTRMSRHESYRSVYDDAARKTVARLYARDIDLLGYSE